MGAAIGGGNGQLIVTVNSGQAINGLNQILSAMNRLANYGQTMTSRLTSGMNSLARSIQGVVAGFLGFHAIRQATRYVSAFLGEMIEVNRSFTGFIASMRVIKGSVEAAGKEYEFLVSMSNRLGIAVETSISQYHRLAASLKNVDKTGQLTRHLFSGLSQAAVVLHSRGRDVTLIFEAVQQMASKGKLSLEELQRQLGNTLPGAVGLAARSMMGSESFIEAGVKNAAEAEKLLRQQIEKGTINVYEFLARFSNQLKVEYADGVAYASTQFTANFNRMKNAVLEFYRIVGTSGAMDGLTKLVNKVTELLNVGAGDGSAGMLGQALGKSFEDLSKWVGQLDAKDIIQFFSAVTGSMKAAMLITTEFMSVFKGIGDIGMKTPIIDFAAFVAESMAGLVDVIAAAVIGIRMLLNSLQKMWIETKAFFTGGMGIAEPLSNGLDRLGASFGVELPGKAGRDHTRQTQAQLRADAYTNEVEYLNLVERGDRAFSSDRSAHGRTKALFDQVRKDYLNTSSGVNYQNPTFDLNAMLQGAAPAEPKAFSGLGSLNFKGHGSLPEFLQRNPAGVAGAYADPQNASDFKAMMDGILAESGAPNAGKGAGARAAKDPVQSNYMREQTRLIKEMAVAETEYQNVLENKNRKEGVNEAQMRSLITTDERYIKLSGDKQERLLSLAKALDDMTLRVQNAIKAQDYLNEVMQTGFDVADRLSEISATGYESQYRALSSMMNSFKDGGENEFMDSANQAKMISAAMREDADQRNLDMASYSSSIRRSNEDMLFQLELLGRSSREQEKMIEFRRIDLEIAKLSVGASQEQMQAYQQLAIILKGEVSEALDQVYAKSQDMAAGIKEAIAGYMDEVSNRAQEWGNVATNALTGMEDALVSFAETGKLSFADLTRSIAKDILKLISRMLVLWMLQQATGMMSKGNYSDNQGSFGSLQGMGDFSLPNAHGNAFGSGGLHAFAKGGAFTNRIYSEPTFFKFGKGGQFSGVMGEAGDEAVVPLSRTSSGDLGINAVGLGGGNAASYLNLKVEVYQGEGDGASTEMSSEGGTDVLKVFIGEGARDVRRGGQIAAAIEETYGLSRKPKSMS